MAVIGSCAPASSVGQGFTAPDGDGSTASDSDGPALRSHGDRISGWLNSRRLRALAGDRSPAVLDSLGQGGLMRRAAIRKEWAPAMSNAKPTRTETDTFGPIEVQSDRYWGAQTQRSLQNFASSLLPAHHLSGQPDQAAVARERETLPGYGQ